ncbi:MAG TPA: ATP-binding SpoIIE family protein phosphatase, partial [Streptosporangiaceae bacterium]|nr:ATP-binding SpoIIE family protein phosphatase [Streptosporangiaceae bacterium]
MGQLAAGTANEQGVRTGVRPVRSRDRGGRTLRARLRFLNDATIKIAAGLDLPETVRGLGHAVVPVLADFVAIHLLDGLLTAEVPGLGEPGTRDAAAAAVRRVVVVDDAVPGLWRDTIPEGEVQVMRPGNPGRQAMSSRQPVLLRRIGPVEAKELAGAHRTGDLEPLVRDHSLLAVPLSVGDRAVGCAIMLRGPGRPAFDDVDVLTATQLAAQASQAVASTCRYRDEAATADALQHSMLPARPPRLAGVEIAHRYLPGSKNAQVGGDWFDAIPLPGSRVALVVGDVMGHGIRSAAIMGHLRTAVQTLAALDLPPEQVLRHLDDLAQRLDDDHLATCIYAVYDPVARTCVIANAGHIPPVLVHADGPAELLAFLPTGAPIGVGGVAFEPVVVKVADGDLLVLCTDGLVEMRGRDIGSGLAALCENLAAPGLTPDGLCETLLYALSARDSEDDVALLIARLRGIPCDDVAEWLLHASPTTARTARRLVRRTLAGWDLSGCGDVAELLASELVTNAARYASRPIGLRLMRTDVLLCEVNDDDHHLPALRHVTDTDEAGRGLNLVSRLARR